MSPSNRWVVKPHPTKIQVYISLPLLDDTISLIQFLDAGYEKVDKEYKSNVI